MARVNKYQGLEGAMVKFKTDCKNCFRKLVVHAWGNKTRKRKEIIRAHCESKGCKEWMIEKSFTIG